MSLSTVIIGRVGRVNQIQRHNAATIPTNRLRCSANCAVSAARHHFHQLLIWLALRGCDVCLNGRLGDRPESSKTDVQSASGLLRQRLLVLIVGQTYVSAGNQWSRVRGRNCELIV